MNRLKKIFKSLLPGIFLFGFTVGTGSVTAMAKAGSDYGMSLLWAVFLSCIITCFMISLFGKYTLVTGETALQSFRNHIHPALSIFFIVTLTAHVCGSVIGVMGIISEVCYVWSKNFITGGIAPVYFAIFFISFVYCIFLLGKTNIFENILAIIVGIMSLCFLINFVLFIPPPMEILKGFVPVLPAAGSGKSPFLIVASMVGTTVFSGLFILRTTLVKEAGWTLADLKVQQRDAMFSGLMMFIVSASIMAAAAATLYVKNIRLENVSEMLRLLEPMAGSLAVAIFALGLIAAGVSSQFPNVALLPWMLDDYNHTSPDMKKTSHRIIVLLISVLGLIVPLFHAKPIAVMIVSQAFGALVLPVTTASIIYVGNKRGLMGEHKFTFWTNLALGGILAFALLMSYMSFTGILETLRSL